MAHGSDSSWQAHLCREQNATGNSGEIKNLNSFRQGMLPRRLWEHDISCCVAFCFVSAKAAVHRKNLDWLWTAALPTESGTEPAERGGEGRRGEESCLQCGIMFPQCLFTITALLIFPLLTVRVFFFLNSKSGSFIDETNLQISFNIFKPLSCRHPCTVDVKDMSHNEWLNNHHIQCKQMLKDCSQKKISFHDFHLDASWAGAPCCSVNFCCNSTFSPQGGNLEATTFFGVFYWRGALGVSLAALKRREDDEWKSEAEKNTSPTATQSHHTEKTNGIDSLAGLLWKVSGRWGSSLAPAATWGGETLHSPVARAAAISLGVNSVTSSLMPCMDYITCNTAICGRLCCAGFEVIVAKKNSRCAPKESALLATKIEFKDVLRRRRTFPMQCCTSSIF